MGPLLESLFEFLFKYRPLVYREGDFVLAASPAMVNGVLIAFLIAALFALSYAWVGAESRRRDRVLLPALLRQRPDGEA